ncbi:MAG TPA: hypothetical protein VFY94_11045, partial [Rhodanobacteraceae bacterium]|nr:hypothetical protein [Rhodanobacteraceae bacterium]
MAAAAKQEAGRDEGGADQEGTARRRSTVLRRPNFTIHVIALVHALDLFHSRRPGDCGSIPVKDASTTRHNRFDIDGAPARSHGICTFRVADWNAPRMTRDRHVRANRNRRADRSLHPALVFANQTGAAWHSYFQNGSR